MQGSKRNLPTRLGEMCIRDRDKLLPKSRSTAQLLYGMYFVLTMVEVILLLLGGMNLFDSLIPVSYTHLECSVIAPLSVL